MEHLNWTWWNKGVPEIEKLKEFTVKQFIDCFYKSVENKQDLSLFSGGIYTKVYYEENNKLSLDFKFVLENWDYYEV